MDTPKNFTQQAARILSKLEAARQADPDLKVFGAHRHKYHLGPPLSAANLAALEATYCINLPACFRAFLTLVGNGGDTSKVGGQYGAGPFYGIYAAEQVLQSVNMASKPVFSSSTTDAEWRTLKAQVEAEVIRDEDLTRGTACIVEQGCSYLNLLVLYGPETGCVVNYDEDECPPQFTYEANFMDWYERWLDEILAGYLLKPGPNLFGFTMGGDDDDLLATYSAMQTDSGKLAAINGFFKLVSISPESANRLKDIACSETGEIRQRTVEALLAYAPEAARPFLGVLIKNKHTNIRSLCHYLGKTTPEFVAAFKVSLLSQLAQCNTHKNYFSVLSLLDTHKHLKPEDIFSYLSHKDPAFRASAVYFLGRCANPAAHTHAFVAALRDDAPRVVRSALQAIRGMDDARLRVEFPSIRARFKQETAEDQTYILSNLAQVEREMLSLKARLKRLLKR